MITLFYIEMCIKAKPLQDIFFDGAGIPYDFIPSFVYLVDKKITGSIHLPVTTIKIKGNNPNFCFLPTDRNNTVRSDKIKLTKDNIIWLPQLEQMIALYKKFCIKQNQVATFSDTIILTSLKEFIDNIMILHKDNDDLIVYLYKMNMNQIMLAFIMSEMFDMIWDIYEQAWKKVNIKDIARSN